MLKILNNREHFYQWDLNQKLIVNDSTITEVHFCNKTGDCSLVCEVYELEGARVVDVPNILLQSEWAIRAYAYCNGCYTKQSAVFKVQARSKPADYVYTETEVWTAKKAVEEALAEAKANGDFKGDKGDKGDAGAINFVVVSELPQEASADSIYLVANATSENNNFDEYIFTNGKWELIGSACVEVDLTNYVKNTDYATSTTVGVVVANANHGVRTETGGSLRIYRASKTDIDSKTHIYRPITPADIDYAVKKALADSKLVDGDYAWTDEEKASARELLGITSLITDLENALQEINEALQSFINVSEVGQ